MTSVVIVTPTLRRGGAELSAVKLAQVLTAANVSVCIVTLVRAHGGDALEREIPPGVKVVRCDGRRTASVILLWRLRRTLISLDPDMIIGWSTYANLAAAWATRTGDRWHLVLSERNYVPRMFRAPGVTVWRRHITLWSMRWLYRRARLLTSNSRNAARFLRRFIGEGIQVAYLPNTVDVHHATRMSLQTGMVLPVGCRPRLLAVGRFDYQKGFDVLLRAFAVVRQEHNWSLALVGDGPERESLERLAKQLDIHRDVCWIGEVSNPYPYYAWADIVVVPSRFEGCPNVLLEAMACGKAVIASDCQTGPSEVLQGGTFGVLVAVDDASALATEILSLGKDRARRQRLGQAARRHVEENYDVEVVAAQYLEVLGIENCSSAKKSSAV